MIRLMVSIERWGKQEFEPAGEYPTREAALAELPGIAAENESDEAWLQVMAPG